MLLYYTSRCKETTVKRSNLVLCYLELVLLSVTFAISMKVFFIKCLFNSLCQIRSFLMVAQSIYLQCADTKRVQLIYPPLIFFRMLSFCHERLRLLCYITDLIYDANNKISVRVVFYFMLSQAPLPTFDHCTAL